MRNKKSRMAITAGLITLLSTIAGAQDALQSRSRDPGRKEAFEDRLASHVFTRIASSGSLAGTDIRLRVEGGVVSLYGAVADEQSKRRVSQIVMRVPGVEDIVNNLRIDPREVAERRNERMSDEQLAKLIADKLVRELFPKARVDQDWMFGVEVDGQSFEFNVDVDAGDVTLSGSVARPEIIDDVIRVVRLIQGVRSVHSELEVNTFDRANRRFRQWGYHPYPFRQAGDSVR